MKKILEFFGTKVFKQVGDVIDNLFTSDEERIKAKNEIYLMNLCTLYQQLIHTYDLTPLIYLF